MNDTSLRSVILAELIGRCNHRVVLALHQFGYVVVSRVLCELLLLLEADAA